MNDFNSKNNLKGGAPANENAEGKKGKRFENNNTLNSDIIKNLSKLNWIKVDICDHNYNVEREECWKIYSEGHYIFHGILNELEYDEDMDKQALYDLLLAKIEVIDKEARYRMVALMDEAFETSVDEINEKEQFHWSAENQEAKRRQL